MTMQDCGMSPEVLQRSNLISDTGKLLNNTSDVSKGSLQECCIESNYEVKNLAQNYVASHIPKRSEVAYSSLLECQGARLSEIHDGDLHSEKRQKVSGPEATESSILDWLNNCDEGVSAIYTQVFSCN